MDVKDLEHIVKTVEQLSEEYKGERLALFVGSGVSKGCGLPDWRELNVALTEEYLGQNFKEPLVWGMSAMPKAIRVALAKLPLPITARYLRQKLGPDYYQTLRHVLYKQGYRISVAMKAIAALDRFAAICTYNYDDLLESCGGHPSVLSSAASRPSGGARHLYHVHGLIPTDPSSPIQGDVIFTEDDYHRVYRDTFHWSNSVQLMLLRQYTTLSVGISFEDPNLRRLLDVVRSEDVAIRRYAIMRRPVETLVPSLGPNQPAYFAVKRLQEESLGSIGVDVLWISDFDTDIATIFRAIASDAPGSVIVNGFLEAGTDCGQGESQCLVPGCDAVRVQHSEFCRAHLVRSRILRAGFPLAFRYAAEEHLATLSERELALGRETYNRSAR